MHKIVAAIVFVIVAALGIHVPAAAAATSSAKIVIVVGPVQGSTSSYRQSADAVYAEAIKYSSNVKKVYSPNATWTKVKAAMAGANIVVYLGHGNGFPSRYATSPRPSSQNGFGLNTPTNPSDATHQYYGEQYIDNVDLAPNAIVLLQRLCYASGAAEPGDPEPSLATARARVDNYAAGFVRAGARAVIADGHQSVAAYIKALFTTNQTIDQLWRTTKSYGHIRTFSSSRSSGMTGYTDPKTSTTGYYRSMVAKGTVTTRQITGVIGDTGVDPGSFVVPGRASVGTPEGAVLFSPTSLAPTGITLPHDTRLAVVSRPIQVTPGDIPLLEVARLDDPTITGYAQASDLVPRDSTAPVVLSTERTPSTFSPNADARFDSTTVTVRFSETVSWIAYFKKADGTILAEQAGSGNEAVATWSDSEVPDGSYAYSVVGRDAWQNAPATTAGTVRVDTTGPSLSNIDDPELISSFSPNGDGYRDSVTVEGSVSESGRLYVRAFDGDTLVRTFSFDVTAGAFTATWNGLDDNGRVVADGTYELRLTARDAYYNSGPSATTSVVVNNLLGSVRSSPALFHPHDGDALAPRTAFSFQLDRAATITWQLRSASGTVLDTFFDGESFDAGTYSRTFDGRTQAGAMLPPGTYRWFVSASDGTLNASKSTAVEMNAFSMKVSDTTPRRGQRVSVTVVSAEPLAQKPRLYVAQPGKSTWSVSMTKVAFRTYKATFTIKTGGSRGTITFVTKGPDLNGATNRTAIRLPLS